MTRKLLPSILFLLAVGAFTGATAFAPALRKTIPSRKTTTWQQDLEARLEELEKYIGTNAAFGHDLSHSLKTANDNAKGAHNTKSALNPELYKAFLLEVNGWATSFEDYFKYLTWHASYVPRQNDYEGWLNGTTQDYYSTHQEVYDQLCHFYYLINQQLPSGGTVQDNTWFAAWLVKYAQVWGKFCNAPESISPESIYSFHKLSNFNVTDSMIPMNEEDIDGNINNYTIYNDKGQPMRPNSPSAGWMSWNQMFARELNPGLRPIDSPTDNSVVCAPADCTFRASYPISADNEVQSNRIKRTHTIGDIADLLKGSQYAEAFANGTFVHYFLGPYSYHRFHTPVAGVVKECFPVPGLTYVDIRIDDKGQFDAPDDSENGYEFAQARGVITIDTTESPYGNVGIVAVIPIGLGQVSSVSMIATEGAKLQKGDEFGYFQFGGSDMIMLFQKGVVPESNLFDSITGYNHFGMQVATATKTLTTDLEALIDININI